MSNKTFSGLGPRNRLLNRHDKYGRDNPVNQDPAPKVHRPGEPYYEDYLARMGYPPPFSAR